MTCDAQVHLGAALIPCWQPSTGRYRRGCIHEHIRDGGLCQDHVDAAAHGLCRTCYELPRGASHECPILLQPLPVGAP